MDVFKEYEQYDGLGLGALVKAGEINPADLVEAAIQRIERLNPRLNAVVHPLYDDARRTADLMTKAPSRRITDAVPFAGVPFLLKDLLDSYAGAPLTSGSRAYQNYIPTENSEIVCRYKRAGLVVLGKTNTPEFGLVAYTEPELFGPTRSPWDTDHTPGGSSGGSAAAVASGMVPLASGGDGGGSIRIPSACCGLFGMKPSRGRVPTGPQAGELWQGATVEGVLSRSVRDSAAALDAIQGADPGSPYTIVPPDRPYLEELRAEPGSLRIAFDTRSPIGTPVDPECVLAVENTARLLADLGHRVEEARPPVDGKVIAMSYITMVCAETAAEVRRIERLYGKTAARAQVELPSRTLALLGSVISSSELVLALEEWGKAGRVMAHFLTGFDLYLTPTLGRPPVRVGELALKPGERTLLTLFNTLQAGKLLRAAGILEKVAFENLAATPFTQLANLTGQPAMSVPMHWTPSGLPVGVHFTAPYGDEARLFRLAAQLELAAPWFDKRPPNIK